jgi:signal transduction histidine kinase/DNA-binding response OmpR family regulator
MNNSIHRTLHRVRVALLIGFSIAIMAVMIAFFAYNVDVESSTYTFSGDDLVFVALLAIAGLWVISAAVFLRLEKVLLSQADQIHESNEELRQRVQARTTDLEKASADLKKSLQAKSEFLATMSHEIRTPMNGVLGMSQLLVETNLSERQRRYVSIINASGKSLLEVLNNVLDFSKIEAGKMEVENIPFDLQSLVDECLGIFSLKAQERKVNLYGGLSPETPRILNGDPTRLRQVLVNLISNAVKFTFDGDVSLQVAVCQEEVLALNRIKLHFLVKDEGIGIDDAQQQKLFKAFSQSNSSTSRKFGGTGLGLVISRQLLHLMGGDIKVTSEEGEGSVFCIELELSVLAEQESATYRLAESSLKGITVLVVESPNAAKLYSQQLRHWGATVYSASSRMEAIERINLIDKDHIIQVLAAISLVDGSGLDLAEDLEKQFPGRKFQIMIIAPITSDCIEVPPPGIHKIIERPVTSSVLHQSVTRASETQPSSYSNPVSLPFRHDFGDIKALVAEDNKINQLVINGILKKFNITPTIVEDGADAVSAIKSGSEFDLILMDCEMPVMDGWEAAEVIRAREASQKVSIPIKIVALSAHVIEDPKKRAIASGMDRFVSKPVNIDSVGEILHEYFPRPPESDSQESGHNF